jgi:hypothetical protein
MLGRAAACCHQAHQQQLDSATYPLPAAAAGAACTHHHHHYQPPPADQVHLGPSLLTLLLLVKEVELLLAYLMISPAVPKTKLSDPAAAVVVAALG